MNGVLRALFGDAVILGISGLMIFALQAGGALSDFRIVNAALVLAWVVSTIYFGSSKPLAQMRWPSRTSAISLVALLSGFGLYYLSGWLLEARLAQLSGGRLLISEVDFLRDQGVFFNVTVLNNGSQAVVDMSHTHATLVVPGALSEENLMRAWDELNAEPLSHPGRVDNEIHVGEKRFFTVPNPNVLNIGETQKTLSEWLPQVRSGSHSLYILVNVFYRDRDTPEDRVIVASYCGRWFGELAHSVSCRGNRARVARIHEAKLVLE